MPPIAVSNMIERFINFVIRPPRAMYDPDQYLWEKDFTLAGRAYNREDLELENGRGQTLKCTHYMPSLLPEDFALPCVVYCHGNSGCRADANEAAVVLLPANITVFTLDFSGSGLSDGNYVSLGWHEKDDLRVVIDYLKRNNRVSCIGLWGRSMGAVTSLLYGSEDPSISGMVLDSAFSNLFDLMMELVDVYKIRLPKFTVKMGLQYMRWVIQRRAKFDIKDLNCIQVASKTFIPAFFGHANGDKLIQPYHSEIIYKSYAGDKDILSFDGDHNSSRPQSYYESISTFFYNTLHPPQVSSAWSNVIEKCHNLKNARVGAGMDEDVISGEVISATNGISQVKDKINGSFEDCCLLASSDNESFGRCSSLEGSDFADYVDPSKSHQMSPNMVCASKANAHSTARKQSSFKNSEKLGALSQLLRLCILKRANSS